MPRSPTLPQHLWKRTYVTRQGVRRTRYYVRFRTWQGVLLVDPAGDQLPYALERRALLRGLNTLKYDFQRDPDQVLGRQPLTQEAPQRFGYWVQRFLALKADKRSIAQDRTRAARLLAFFGDCLLTELTRARIEAYVLHCRHTPLGRALRLPAPATVNRHLALLRAMLRMAHAHEAMRTLPPIPLLPERNRRERIVSPEEFASWLAQVRRRDVRDVLEVLWEQGWRVSETLRLTRDQVDLRTETVLFPPQTTKSGLPRRVPLAPRTVAILAARLADPAASPYCFTTAKGQPLQRRWFHRLAVQALRRAGLRDLWVHDLRGSFITRKVIEEGYDRTLVKLATGHVTDSAFQRYLRPTLEHVRAMLHGDSNKTATPSRRYPLAP